MIRGFFKLKISFPWSSHPLLTQGFGDCSKVKILCNLLMFLISRLRTCLFFWLIGLNHMLFYVFVWVLLNFKRFDWSLTTIWIERLKDVSNLDTGSRLKLVIFFKVAACSFYLKSRCLFFYIVETVTMSWQYKTNNLWERLEQFVHQRDWRY